MALHPLYFRLIEGVHWIGAGSIRCFAPALVVVDTCFGASSELLAALGDLDAVVVAAASLLPSSGFVYDREFFTAEDPWRRAAAVRTQPATELLRWRNDPTALRELLGQVDAMSASELGERLARRRPTAVKVALPGGGPVLVPIAWERLGPTRPRPRPRIGPRPATDR